MFRTGERVKFRQSGCNTGTVLQGNAEETLVKFDDGDICPVSTDYLQAYA